MAKPNQIKREEIKRDDVDHPGASSAWMIVRPLPNKQRMLIERAKASGFECYLPIVLREKWNIRARQVTVISSPMFPGYVLARVTTGLASDIFRMPGVMPGEGGVLRTCLLDVLVQEIKSREVDGMIELLKPPKRPKRGERVKTIVGMVDAIIGEEVVDTNRISLVTGMFKGSARMTCRLDQVIRH